MGLEVLRDCLEIGKDELNQAVKNAVRQTESCIPEFSGNFKMIYSNNHFYMTAPNIYWTNAFWTGELWLMYEISGLEKFKNAALLQVNSFRERIEMQIKTDTHDLGFLYTLSCVAAYKLLNKEEYKNIALMAATKLNSRFHKKGEFIQAWGSLEDKNNYRLIIDSLLNMPLLFWASEVSGDSKYADNAKKHIQSTLDVVIREDFSTYHTYYFSKETGEALYGETHQGYSVNSAWARGQAWGIYGIALAIKYMQNERYEELFDQLLNYFLKKLDEDLIPYWDLIFTKKSGEPWDSSASAIVICALLEMSRHVPEKKAEIYTEIAKKLMKALVDKCAVKDPSESNGQILHGVYCKSTPFNNCINNGIDECNLWGDYFYIEALVRLLKDWKTYW